MMNARLIRLGALAIGIAGCSETPHIIDKAISPDGSWSVQVCCRSAPTGYSGYYKVLDRAGKVIFTETLPLEIDLPEDVMSQYLDVRITNEKAGVGHTKDTPEKYVIVKQADVFKSE